MGKIPIRQLGKDGKLIKKFASITEAADELGIAKANISAAVSGGRKSAGGFHFELDKGQGV